MQGILFFAEILALASFVWHQNIHLRLSRDGGLALGDIVTLLVFSLLLGVLISASVRCYIRKLASKTSEPASRLYRCSVLTFSPFLLLFFIFLQYVAFLKDIRSALLPLSLTGFVYLHSVFLLRLKREHPDKIFVHKIWKSLSVENLSPRRLSILVFSAAVLIYGVLATRLVFPPQPLTGDEPHYLLISQSLLHDRDINLFNNYRNRDYLRFYPGEMPSHASPGRKGAEYQYAKHLPALPLLLVPFYFLGEKLGSPVLSARFLICLITGLLSWTFFLTVQDILRKRSASLVAWFAFSFTSPMIFYSHLIYPEVPAALILLLIFRLTVLNTPASVLVSLLAGLGLAALPWFGVKYTALSAAMLVVIIFPLLPSWRKNIKSILSLICFPVVSAFLYLFYLWSLYGNFSPLSIYRGAPPYQSSPQSVGINDSALDIVRTGLGFFLDQRIGIFVYAPIYVLFIAGAYWAGKKIKKIAIPLLVIFVLYWLFCSIFPYWLGFCPPGRPLLTVLWMPALFTALALSLGGNRLILRTGRLAMALSLLVAYLGTRNPRLLYHENLANPLNMEGLNSHLLVSLNNIFIDWSKIVPSVIGWNTVSWRPLIFWSCAVVVLTLIFLRAKDEQKKERPYDKLGSPAVWVLVLSFLLLGHMFFRIRLNDSVSYEGRDYELIFQDKNNYGKELGGFWTKGTHATGVLVSSSQPVSRILVRLSSAAGGKTAVRVDRYKGIVERTSKTGRARAFIVDGPVGFLWKGRYLYSLQFREFRDFVPFQVDKNTRDNRSLGVFIEIETFPRRGQTTPLRPQ